MTIKVITGPTLEPITLAEAKLQCRVDLSDEDSLITSYITAAREWCEKIDWRAYLTQTLELWLDAWPDDRVLMLPRPPMQSVTKIEYYDTADIKYTLVPADYYVSQAAQPGRIHLTYEASWPNTTLREMEAICITYKAGWTAAASVPQRIKQAIMLLVGYWYANREAASLGSVSREIDFSVRHLLGVDRAMRF